MVAGPGEGTLGINRHSGFYGHRAKDIADGLVASDQIGDEGLQAQAGTFGCARGAVLVPKGQVGCAVTGEIQAIAIAIRDDTMSSGVNDSGFGILGQSQKAHSRCRRVARTSSTAADTAGTNPGPCQHPESVSSCLLLQRNTIGCVTVRRAFEVVEGLEGLRGRGTARE